MSGGNIEEKQGFTNIEVNAALQNEQVLLIKKKRREKHISTQSTKRDTIELALNIGK